jgi:transcriptional regulator with XRE-family HTH domain
MEIGKTIRRLRQEKNWAIEDLAAYLDDVKGGDKASISKIETGQRWPRPDVLRGIAAAFGLQVHQLFALAEGAEIVASDLTPEELEWVRCLKLASAEARSSLLQIVRELSSKRT